MNLFKFDVPNNSNAASTLREEPAQYYHRNDNTDSTPRAKYFEILVRIRLENIKITNPASPQ